LGSESVIDRVPENRGILKILHIPDWTARAANAARRFSNAAPDAEINRTLDGDKSMSDIEALKKEKQDLIDKMLEMQKQFIEHEHEHGVTGKDYWASSDGLLANYRQEYMDMANRVVDIAHEIVGSNRL
jgi:hypothetical protein